MRTLLQGYTVQDIELPLLVVRICPCREALVGCEREYRKKEMPILGCKRTRERQRRQRDRAPETVQASRTGSVRTAVVEAEVVRSSGRYRPSRSQGSSLGRDCRRKDRA